MIERSGSPPGRSILTTSAPQSASTAAHDGTKPCSASSTTLTPSSTPMGPLLAPARYRPRAADRSESRRRSPGADEGQPGRRGGDAGEEAAERVRELHLLVPFLGSPHDLVHERREGRVGAEEAGAE